MKQLKALENPTPSKSSPPNKSPTTLKRIPRASKPCCRSQQRYARQIVFKSGNLYNWLFGFWSGMVIEIFYFNCFLAFANLLHKIEFYLRFDTVLDCFLRYFTFCFFKTSYDTSQNELLQIGLGWSLSTSDGSKHITWINS